MVSYLKEKCIEGCSRRENKLCLGTVQLGMKYGIKNQLNRKPTIQESFTVLETAIQRGIDYFDTASIYGNAEEVLGEFGINKYNVKVISKLKPNLDIAAINIVNQVQIEIEKSLQRLNINYLDGYLLHEAKDFYRPEILDGLLRCKKKGLIKHIGVSIYEPEDAVYAVQSGMVDYIQIPYNVFDQRLDRTEFFVFTKKNKIKVFARSVFLQGLLLLNEERIPNYLKNVKPYLIKFHQIINKYNYSPVEAAFLFSYLHEGIDKVVFGVDTSKQLIDNFSILEKISAFKLCYNELFGAFLDIDRKIITPSLWG